MVTVGAGGRRTGGTGARPGAAWTVTGVDAHSGAGDEKQDVDKQQAFAPG